MQQRQHEYAREFDPDPSSVKAARDFVSAALKVWDVDDLADVAVLLTSELVTNAVLHARTVFQLAARYRPPEVVIEVTDASAEPAELADASQGALSGRGLALVRSMANRWGVSLGDAGKSVWFSLTVAARQPDPADPPPDGDTTGLAAASPT
jgi:anti-sigma regulatory factor (Ser/Thr protein kinase)